MKGSDSIRLTAEAAAHGYELGEVTIADTRAPLAGEVLASIVQRTQAKAGRTLEFATLAPLVERYLSSARASTSRTRACAASFAAKTSETRWRRSSRQL